MYSVARSLLALQIVAYFGRPTLEYRVFYGCRKGVQNIRRWTQFCDPTKKKKGDDITGGWQNTSVENRIVSLLCRFRNMHSSCSLIHHSWALSLTISSVVSSSSHLSLVALSLGAILWPSGVLSICICFLILTQSYGGVDPLGVFPLFLR